jgi:hypothetical protein
MINLTKKRFLYTLLFTVLSLFVLYEVCHYFSPADSNRVKTYQVSGGWGYQIIIKNKVLIDQPFIPGLPGKLAFPDKKSAAKTGKIVLQRLLNHQSPTITEEDIKEMGIDVSGI